MGAYLKHIANILYRLSIVIAFYSLCRLLFYLFNQHSFTNGIANAFLFGVRFDYSAVIQYNLLFLVLFLLPFNFVNRKLYQKIVTALFYVVNFFLIALNLIDIEYFKYTGKRSSADLFSFVFMSDDVVKLLPQFMKDFWYIVIFAILGILGGIYLLNNVPYRKIEKFNFSVKQWVIASLLFILVPGLLFLGARGTGLKPIRMISAARYTQSQNIPLLLNTPFCILHTINNEDFKATVYFKPEEVAKIFDPEINPEKTTKSKNDNVVIVILESFSKEFVGSLTGKKSYTPHFDSIIGQSLVFDNAYANGKQSIQALPAILASLPGLMDINYISSRYSGNRLDGLPSILASKGYHTSFFHGGRNGTMGFDEFSHVTGIKNYYGLYEYDGPEAFDGNWGIFDEEFMQFYAKKLSLFPQPFFSSIFTLSSHHPYKVPDKYKKMFGEKNEQLAAIRYADYALGKFFAQCRLQPWFKNTLFVFVADHTAKEISREYGSRAGIYRIPLAFYHPGDSTLKGTRHNIAQQTDIMPSVLGYLGITSPYFAFGQNLFNTNQSFSINYSNGIYQYFEGDFMLTFDGERSTALNNISKDKMLVKNLLKDSTALAGKMELKTKAIIQQYSTRVIDNKLYHR